MCGRFALHSDAPALAQAFELADLPALPPRYNVAPSQAVLGIRTNRESGQREWTLLQWGLIPAWSKDPGIGSKLINARAETVAEKPSFRSALKYRRCLIPADGFYEWQKSDGRRQPYYIHLKNDQPFAFAGLWEHWNSPDGSEVETCTILTTTPNELMKSLHDRMPVILEPDDYDLWLDPEVQKADILQPLLRPYPAEAMEAYPISLFVNHPANDDPRVIEPIGG